MYLVIKNGDTKKSYQCTNTCNKPRVRVSNSYIPLTNNIQSKPKCIINSMEVASYKSYTYTGEQGTVTTGTTYLTRSSTSSTVYGTKQSILSSDIKRVYTTCPAYVYGSFRWTEGYAPGPHDMPYTSSYSKYGLEYVDGPAHTISVIRTVDCLCSFNNFHGPVSGTLYTSSDVFGVGVYFSGTVTHNISVRFSSKSTAFNKYLYSELSTVYTSTVVTTGTSYQTRASTSGTSYGTKTTNKTLTSSSWG